MEENKQHLEALTEIRAMMEKSTKFISLSGLSGVAAGIFGLFGAIAAYVYLEIDFNSD
jgi:predicted lysophospholipase L1 biosynthesis ABC-type transport system permease subunit